MAQSLAETLQERGGRYGPLITSGRVAQELEDTLRALPNWQKLEADQKEALSMIAHKISRIMAGDPNYDDSWVDIAGYAKLVADRLQKEQRAQLPTASATP